MKLQDGIYSLKLECNLRNYGYVPLFGTCVAKSGSYFVRPIGYYTLNDLGDELFGFQIGLPEEIINDFEDMKKHLPFCSSAKKALDYAFEL